MLCAAMLCLSSVVAVDGDTFRAETPWGRQYFRVWGISAPERHEPPGPASTASLAGLASGQVLACDLAGLPSYSRLVVRCDLPDGRDLACEQVAAGHATDWPLYSRGIYEACEP